MKIYIQDHGWRGCLVALAKNEDEARVVMKSCYNYESTEPLIEFDPDQIPEPGLLLHENMGDS